MNRVANARTRQDHRIDPADGTTSEIELSEQHGEEDGGTARRRVGGEKGDVDVEERAYGTNTGPGAASGAGGGAGGAKGVFAHGRAQRAGKKMLDVLRKYAKFVGPGFMVAVAYIDPGKLLSLRRRLFVLSLCRFSVPCYIQNDSSASLPIPVSKLM